MSLQQIRYAMEGGPPTASSYIISIFRLLVSCNKVIFCGRGTVAEVNEQISRYGYIDKLSRNCSGYEGTVESSVI